MLCTLDVVLDHLVNDDGCDSADDEGQDDEQHCDSFGGVWVGVCVGVRVVESRAPLPLVTPVGPGLGVYPAG